MQRGAVLADCSTATSPLGCHDESRFPPVDAMYEQIMEWNRSDPGELDD